MKVRVTLLLCLAAACGSGCIKVRLTVQLDEDGSGRVLEDIVFTDKLVSLAKRVTDVPTIEELSSEQALRARAEKMGPGVRFVSRQVETLKDGSVRTVAAYAFDDLNGLKLAPFPFGRGWEDGCLKFELKETPGLWNSIHLRITLTDRGNEPASQPSGDELESQRVRQLLPVFRDMLDGFELSLRLELYRREQWSTATRGHPEAAHESPLNLGGGRLTLYRITDRELKASEDGMLMVVPWQFYGREFKLTHYHRWVQPQIMPYTNYINERSEFSYYWRFYPTPHGREYY